MYFVFFILTIWVTLAILPNSSYAGNIKFYEKQDNHGFLFEDPNVSTTCTNIKDFYDAFRGSVTTDSCILIYNRKNCLFQSVKLSSGDTYLRNLVQTSVGPYNFSVLSYRLCDDHDGGNNLHVDLYNNKTFKDVQRHQRYSNVCSCQNLPKDLTSGVLTLDNHGNNMNVYTDENCHGESKHIKAGQNYDTEHPNYFRAEHQSKQQGNYFETIYKTVVSIGPDPKSNYFFKTCVKLNGRLYKFQFLNDTEAAKPERVKIELALDQTFVNNGGAKITEEYTKTKTEKESVEIEHISSLEQMSKVEVEASVSVESGFKAPFLADAKVQLGLRSAVETQDTTTSTTSKKTKVKIEKQYSIKKQIEVPPCHKYTVSSYVEKVKNAQFLYKGYLKIQGEHGGEKMRAGEIKKYLKEGMVYERDVDEYTVEAVVTGKMTAEYGIKSYIRGKGHKIAGCKY